MTSKYAAYTVYGEDKCRLVLGSSKELDNKKRYLHGDVIEEAFTKCNAYNFIVIDWKRYKVKYHLNGLESIWHTFKSNEFWKMFRFTTPCEDWEIQAYGRIR